MRTLYDIIFLIVVTTLGLNIVIAILVDRFTDLREERVRMFYNSVLCVCL